MSRETTAMVLKIQWRSKEGGMCGHAPWGAGLEGASALFLQSFKNVF